MQLTDDRVEAILAAVVRWATHRHDIAVVALVGSWARGSARADSDVDLVVLTPNPLWFRRNEGWLQELDWHTVGSAVAAWRDADYGMVWSRHVKLVDGTEIEFGFGPVAWVARNPIDPGTRQVIGDGCRILHDPTGLLKSLVAQIRGDD